MRLGKWLEKEDENGFFYECTSCGYELEPHEGEGGEDYNYCPHCGAMMEHDEGPEYIKPCPFCGSTNISFKDEGMVCYMECEDCGAHGPEAPSYGFSIPGADEIPFMLKPIPLWNKREDKNENCN